MALSEIEEKAVVKKGFARKDVFIPKNTNNRASIWDRLYNDSFDRQTNRKNREEMLSNLLGTKWTMDLIEKNQLYYDINGVGLFFDNVDGQTFLDVTFPGEHNEPHENLTSEPHENLFLTSKQQPNSNLNRTMPEAEQEKFTKTNNKELYNLDKIKNRGRQIGKVGGIHDRNAIRPSTAQNDPHGIRLAHINSFSVERDKNPNGLDMSCINSAMGDSKQNVMAKSSANSVDLNRQRKYRNNDSNRIFNQPEKKDNNVMVPVVPLSDGRLGIALDDLSKLLSKVLQCAKNRGNQVDKCTQTVIMEEDFKKNRTKKAGNLFGEMIEKHRENMMTKKKHNQTSVHKVNW